MENENIERSLIEIKNISKVYNEGTEGEVRAVDNISLKIDKGEFVAILGKSGSGKSTLMNILGCLDIPTYGEYYLNGKAVNRMKRTQLSQIRSREIGFIFQGFNLISSLTAKENVELPLIYKGIKREKRKELVYKALEQVGLLERMNHYPNEMSGGQQQRVAIARAVAAYPPVIMADEPTGNLDSKAGLDVMKKLCELNDTGATIILITHDRKLATMAKRIITIIDGKLIGDRVLSEDERSSGEHMEEMEELV